MAYSELIKNFNKIRDYMREFYVYGFKSRDEYTKKSARSYDDERRRLESWLGSYMQFRQTPEGKNVFLSIDSRKIKHNPLYRAWKAKSFTDGDITLHFIVFDILHSPDVCLSLNEISEKIDESLLTFEDPKFMDISTVRKKLNEYVSEGILSAEKRGKTMYYRRADDFTFDRADILDFFSEVTPCGVVGSYLLDKTDDHEQIFSFKHHYITGALDSNVLYTLLNAIGEKRCVTFEVFNRRKDTITEKQAVPLKVMISAQSGRQYLMAYTPSFSRISAYRIDNITSAKPENVSERFDALSEELESMKQHIWGISTGSFSDGKMDHVDFTVRYSEDETFIHRRLLREKRCGTVEKIDANTSRFSADVYDASEMIPWIRTFICRITEIHISDPVLEAQFKDDIKAMYELYGVEEGVKS